MSMPFSISQPERDGVGVAGWVEGHALTLRPPSTRLAGRRYRLTLGEPIASSLAASVGNKHTRLGHAATDSRMPGAANDSRLFAFVVKSRLAEFARTNGRFWLV
jgi:hypothetical protein